MASPELSAFGHHVREKAGFLSTHYLEGHADLEVPKQYFLVSYNSFTAKVLIKYNNEWLYNGYCTSFKVIHLIKKQYLNINPG